MVFVRLALETSSGALAPGERRALTVRAWGTTAKVNLEARNLATDVAELVGGVTVRSPSSGGANNVAKFELIGKKHGNFVISIRLLAPLSLPRL